MKLSDSEIEIIINTLRTDLPSLQAIYIFGSFADETASDSSDVDIAYLSEGSLSNTKRWELSSDIARLLKRDVDLIDLRSANTIFRYQIISTAKRVYGGGYEVESFETLVYSFYLRFKQERKPIEDAIIGNLAKLGKSNV